MKELWSKYWSHQRGTRPKSGYETRFFSPTSVGVKPRGAREHYKLRPRGGKWKGKDCARWVGCFGLLAMPTAHDGLLP